MVKGSTGRGNCCSTVLLATKRPNRDETSIPRHSPATHRHFPRHSPGHVRSSPASRALALNLPPSVAHLTWQAVSSARRESTPERNLSAAPDPPATSALLADDQKAPAFRLELAGPAHARGMLAIYNREVESGTATFDMSPRSLEGQLEWVAEHSGAHPAVVAVTMGRDGEHVVVGFGSLSPYRPRAAYSTTVEDSVYVAEGSQRLGIGRAILDELLRLAEAHGFHSVIARIAGENDASVALHASCGFEMIGTEREVGRKFGRWLDVVCMQRLI